MQMPLHAHQGNLSSNVTLKYGLMLVCMWWMGYGDLCIQYIINGNSILNTLILPTITLFVLKHTIPISQTA